MVDQPTPFDDGTQSPAYPILAGDPVLSQENRATLFDTFHQSKNPDELVKNLQKLETPDASGAAPLVVPDDTKKRLYQAKQDSMPVAGPLDKVVSAVDQIAKLDPQKRELAETHPNLLKVFTTAATTPEKEPESASAGSSGSGKGKKASDGGSPASEPLPPRPDGLPHLPMIPEDHYRVMASDSGLHDIPKANIRKAFEIDPRLKVMNPDA